MKRISIIMVCAMFSFTMMYAQETKKKSNKKTVTFLIENMNCQNCINKIEKNIAFEKGVTNLKCDLSTRTTEVTYRTDKTTEDKLVSAFDKIEMKARVLDKDENSKRNDSERSERNESKKGDLEKNESERNDSKGNDSEKNDSKENDSKGHTH